MFIKLRTRLAGVIAASLLMAVPMLASGLVFAAGTTDPTTISNPNVQNDLSCGATFNVSPTTDCGQSTTTGAGKVQGIVTTAVDFFSIIVGLIAVVMLIYGGLKYITSGGDSSKAASARTAIVSAVIGLVIVALAQVIVQFVLTKANPNSTNNGSGTNTNTNNGN